MNDLQSRMVKLEFEIAWRDSGEQLGGPYDRSKGYECNGDVP